MTDRHIYEIKSLKKTKELNEQISQIIKVIKIKLIVFFALTAVVFLFYWYCLASFCAVYQKSQGFLILNAFLSILVHLIDPFIIYAIIAFMRVISLKYSNKKGIKWVYNISKFFPIF